MKKTYILLIVMGLTWFSVTGQSDYTQRLSELLGTENMAKLETNMPGEVGLYAYVNAKGYQVSAIPSEKEVIYTGDALEIAKTFSEAPNLTLQLLESGDADLLAYAFRINQTKHLYYSIGESGQMLVILPMELLKKRYESYSGTINP